MIISMQDDKGFFVFNLVGIKNEKKSLNTFQVLRPDLEVITVTKNEFYKKRKHLRENMSEITLATGQKLTEKNRQYADWVKKTDNNHIEVY